MGSESSVAIVQRDRILDTVEKLFWSSLFLSSDIFLGEKRILLLS